MSKFRVGRTDCYSFFGWTPEDEGRAASALVPPHAAVVADCKAAARDDGAAKKRKREGAAADAALRDGFGVEADAALIGALCALERSGASVAGHGPSMLSTAATRAVTASRACGLELFLVAWKHPANIGAVLRLAGCFGVQRVHHVRRSAAPVSMNEHQRRAMLQTARGCERLVERRQWSMEQLLGFLDQSDAGDGAPPRRLPIVALETAEGAVPITSFTFPRRCCLLAGAEGRGIELKVLRRLRRGYDAIVYVPMPGAHKSLNAAEAVCCASYEYRRQWPG